MSKLRVHDMAGEFGISSDEVMALLKSMDVPVRTHLSPLSDDQIARVRARWEREKRLRSEKQSGPSPARRRRGAAAAAPEPEPVAPAAAADAPGVRRRRRVDVVTAPPADIAASATGAEIGGGGVTTIADPSESAAAGVDVVTPFAPSERERSTRDESRVPEARDESRADAPLARGLATTADAARVAGPVTGRAAPTGPPTPGTPRAEERPRPRPVVPGAPRPRPVASASPFLAPRPVASATPSAGSAPPRREERRPSGPSAPLGAPLGRRGKKGKRGAVDQEAVTANISKTMTALRGAPGRRGGRPFDDRMAREELVAQRAALAERERTTVRVNEFITVSELAQTLKISATEIISFAMKNLGLMVTINQRLDFDQIDLIAGEFGFQAVREEEYAAQDADTVTTDLPEELKPRPPVITIMGHVDHGKTSLLDYIRKANVVAGEAGGITQHIGAYHVSLPGGRAITFLDTPGHEAFTAMRARGAQVTDIVVLVVAADDAVMPQTVEAISHAKNAGVPIIVAINKIDLPQANVPRVKQDLLQHGVVLEEFGGQTLSTEISAKKGTNVSTLLDQLLLQADLLDLRANPNRHAAGAVVEAQLDPGKGSVATVLVQNGTLRVGDDFICGLFSGRVRALLDERGKAIKEAGPAIPTQVLGMTGTPMAGDQFLVVEDAGEAREIAQRRERLDREAKSRRTSKGAMSLADFMSQTSAGEKRTLKLLIKADQGGPAEAVADALQRLSNEEVQVEVIQRGVGAVTESDILLAKASGAIIIGFHVRPDNKARAAAEREGVEIKLYRIIYEAVADVRAALEGLLRPEERETVVGEAEVLQLFKVPKAGTIAGCRVRSGLIARQHRVRVLRDGVQVYEGTISSLRRIKDDVREVREGFECGIGIENFNDIKVGDVIESYQTEQIARTLDATQPT